uniref:FAD-dependent oxidoreductase n=1 Tax=Thermus islandicus TaxID=540988 RepID=A0A7C2C2U9_9DEIN
MRALLLLLLVLTPAWAQYDLLVYGATPQGVAAAVAGAQEGLKVLLLEPGRGVGGVLTQGWLATLDLTKDREGLLQGGLFRDFYRRVGQEASFDVREAERVLWAMLREAGVEVRLEEPVDRLEREGSRLLALATPKGTYPALYFVDATDTAELAFRAGASFTLGREDTGLDQRAMAATLVFRLEGVPWGAVLLALNYDGQVRRTGAGAWGRSGWGFGDLARGYVPSDPARYALRGLNLARQDDGSLLVNALLIFGVDGTDPLALERVRAEAALEADRVVAFLREKDPLVFGTARLAGVAPALYLRESRHLKALYRLRAEEVLLGRNFPDAVALGGYPLDGQAYFPRETPYLLGTPAPYGVPFRALVPGGPCRWAWGGRRGGRRASLARPPQAGLEKAPLVDFHQLAQSSSGVEALRKRLLGRGARLSSEERGRPEEGRRGFREAVSLLRRGLFAGPYYLRGSLGLADPILLGDFLANLEHYYRAKGLEDRLRVVLKARELYREELQRPLGRRLLNQLLLALGEAGVEGPEAVSRGEAAELLFRLLP